MKGNVTCSCGHSWSKSDSSKKDASVCHICGKDNKMKDGGWLDKYQEGGQADKWQVSPKGVAFNKAARQPMKDIDAIAANALGEVMSYPQRKITELVTGTNQYPSEAMGITNPYGAFAVDAIADPVNLVGAGLLGKFAKTKAFKLNPRAFKANPEAYYHRSPDLEHVINRETGMLQGFGESEAGKAYSELAYGKGPEAVKNIGTTNEYISTLNLKKPANNQLYFAKGTPLDYGRYNPSGQGYKGPYMIEAEGIPMGASTKGRRPKASPPKYIEGYATAHRPISADEVKFYKEHWWQGYKPIEVPKKENGGWLDKYNDGGPIQPNYNDSNASAGPGFEGDGYSNVGRNYSPAWGGQFAMGGSIGGATQGIPGATGFMYARVAGSTPSKGKGRNKVYKTDASAQNGKEMKFYQEGLDFKPKSISKNGSELIKLDQLSNFTNYNTKQPGGWLDRYDY